jgi:16S rRNA G966 N2-methylase RsmD
MHPTVKPVAMIADAIKDVSERGAVVLDLFGGSGSTLIAAHKTGRRAFLVEIDPAYCDTTIARYEAYAHDDAVLVSRLDTANPGVQSVSDLPQSDLFDGSPSPASSTR